MRARVCVYVCVYIDHPLASRPFTGPNQWPANAAWRHTMHAYFTSMHHLSLRLTGLLALSLDLPKVITPPLLKASIHGIV